MADARFNPEEFRQLFERQVEQIQLLKQQQESLQQQLRLSIKDLLQGQINGFLRAIYSERQYVRSYHITLMETLVCIGKHVSQGVLTIEDVLDLFFAKLNLSHNPYSLVNYPYEFASRAEFILLVEMMWKKLKSREDYERVICSDKQRRLLFLTNLTIGGNNSHGILSQFREASKKGYFVIPEDFYDRFFDDYHSWHPTRLVSYLSKGCLDEQTKHSNGKFIFDLLRHKQDSILGTILASTDQDLQEKILEVMLNDKKSSIYQFMNQPPENASIKKARAAYAKLKGFAEQVVEMVAVSSDVTDPDVAAKEYTDDLDVGSFFLVEQSLFTGRDENAAKIGVILKMADATSTENGRLCENSEQVELREIFVTLSDEIEALKTRSDFDYPTKYRKAVGALLTALICRRELLKGNEVGRQLDDLMSEARKFLNLTLDLTAHHAFKAKLYAALNPEVQNRLEP